MRFCHIKNQKLFQKIEKRIDPYPKIPRDMLLTNMLDNAIEASERQDEKIIELVFSLIGGFQNTSCKNPIKQSIASNPDSATTKPDKSLHGYGIKSMKKAVESANGMIEFYEEDGYFICHAAIPLG